MSILDIPITNPPQTFSVTLNGTVYSMTVKWNDQAQVWNFDLYDSSGNLLIGGIAMTAGDDLLTQFGYLNIGGQLWAISTDTPDTAVPEGDFGQPSSDGHLYFVAIP